ncbi:tripartite tricarboxylate transporter substrate binding protein [Stappia sp. BW2]|uniref:tripartite tricarboxylate transporter substrate binding protein n=1 Tax=Stappia sp. BW2 TaxID=2592622 RepID=UPI0011DE7167|nr:tripartite tricarboxylate transporter substrate binding protein [Stappia sp. BW2]TYC69066.1 tripartite tricarboxylate transporter substrate binding protein [Stappia sp. BW2]
MKKLLLGIALLPLVAAPALAEYPERAIEVTVPAPAGGGTDTSARKLAILLEKELAASMAILNVAGGGGSVGVTQFMQAQPDGYSLLATWNSPITTVPQVQKTAYGLDSFTPIASTSETAYTMCVKPDFPAEDGAQFLDELAANPNKYTYGNDGIGGTMQLAAERIFQQRDIKAVAIPFGGAGETLQNFLGGHIDIYGGSISPVLPYVESGEAKCLIVTSASTVDALPQAAGLESLDLAAQETLLWRMFLAPAGLDQAIADRLVAALEKTVNDPEYVEFLATKGEIPHVVTGEALSARLQSEFDGLAEAAKNLGLSQ